MGREQRRFKNWLISPFIQLKISGHVIMVVLFFMFLILGVTYWRWNEIFNLLVEMTDVPQLMREFLSAKFLSFFIILICLLTLQFLTIMAIMVIHTHRFLGPAYAIRKFVKEKFKEKDFSSRIHLRKGDYLKDVAGEINSLADQLQKEGQES